MSEVAKPDYLSLVNQGGSGFNVSELVTAIVASEIEPKRAMQTTKQEKTENAISGIGFLNSQVALTQKNFNTIAGDSFFNISSTNTSGVEIIATDEATLEEGNRTIENVTLAKKMVFELAGFANLTILLQPVCRLILVLGLKQRELIRSPMRTPPLQVV